YSPIHNQKRALERRNYVLKNMLEQDFIDKKEYQAALREKIIAPGVTSAVAQAPYFVDFVQSQLREQFSDETLQAEGHRIFTTLDLDTQRVAEKTLQEGLNALEEGYPNLAKRKKEGKTLQALLIAITPQTGYIRAYIGGRDFHTSQFNRPSSMLRQPGSAFKPFVYLSALDPEVGGGHYTVATLLDDEPITLETPEGDWTPKNYDEEIHGKVMLRTALEKSYNIATVRLALDVGLEKVVQTARRAGIQSNMDPFPAMALGAFEVTPLELAEAYTIFPNNGTRSQILPIRYVITKEGTVLESKEMKMKRAFSKESIFLMNNILMGVMDHGTAASSRLFGFNLAAGGKTGTTSEYRDAWFVGYTPELLTIVWVGYDDNSPTGLTGAQAALPIWSNFMKQVTHKGLAFPTLPAIEYRSIDPVSGLLATRHCPESSEEPFLKGSEPKERCPLH
ncbi:MAG: penicillin-binding transpeptidase domain-containing protein, partial [bacterium]|nr:penicillin-binding transpeptidase domain-containing protein [bacterium]